MTFRKNVFSYLLWAVFTASVCIYHIAIVTLFLDQTPIEDEYAQMGVIGLTIVLAAGLFVLLRKLAKNRAQEAEKQGVSHLIWEATLAVLLLGAGIFIRAYMVGEGTQEAAFFETASVTGLPVIPIAHGAQYLYVLVLRGLFIIVGNSFTAGIILQILLQALTALVWYLGIRRLSGPVTSLIFLAGTMLLPSSVQEGITYSPRMLYLLLYGFVFLMVGRFLRRQKTGTALKWYSWVQTVILGIGIGVLTYLDVSGLTLILPVLFIYGVKEEGEAQKGIKRFINLSLQVMTIILVFFLTVFLLMFADGMQNNADVMQVFNTWCMLFSYKEIGRLPILLYPNKVLGIYTMPIVSFLLVLGIPAFFVHEKRETQMLYFFFLSGVAVILAGNFHASGMTAGYLAFSLVLALAGVGIQAALLPSIKEPALVTAGAEIQDVKKDAPEEKAPTENKSESIEKTESVKKAEMKKNEKAEMKKAAKEKAEAEKAAKAEKKNAAKEKKAKNSSGNAVAAISGKPAAQSGQKGNYIENPLPLPKRHETKVLDYPYFVATDKLRYDVKVSPDDDFDI